MDGCGDNLPLFLLRADAAPSEDGKGSAGAAGESKESKEAAAEREALGDLLETEAAIGASTAAACATSCTQKIAGDVLVPISTGRIAIVVVQGLVSLRWPCSLLWGACCNAACTPTATRTVRQLHSLVVAWPLVCLLNRHGCCGAQGRPAPSDRRCIWKVLACIRAASSM